MNFLRGINTLHLFCAAENAEKQDMFTDAHIELLTQRSLLSLVFERGELGSVFAHLNVRECQPGETFVHEGEPADHVYIPLEGEVELFLTIKGKTVPSGSLLAGRTMNTFAIVHQANYQYSARFKTTGMLCKIPTEIIAAKLEANPRLKKYLLGMTEDHDIRAIAKELDEIGCSHKFKIHFLAALETESFGPQDWIIKPGETVPKAFFLLEGNVVTHKPNAPQIPSRVWFGWRTVSEGQTPTTFLKAVSNTRLFTMSQAEYEKVSEAFPHDTELYSNSVLVGHQRVMTDEDGPAEADEVAAYAVPVLAPAPVSVPSPVASVTASAASPKASIAAARAKLKETFVSAAPASKSLKNNGQLRELFRGARREVLLSSAMAVLGVCLGLLLPFLSQLFFDDVLLRRDLNLLKLGLGVLGVAILASGFLAWVQARYSRYLMAAFERSSNLLFTKKILTLAGGMFAGRHFGDFKRRVSDLSYAQTSLFQFFTLAVFAGLTLVVHGVILSFYSPLLALVIGALALTLYAITSSRLAHEHFARYLWRVSRFILMGAAAVIAVLKGLTPGQVVAAAMIAGQSLTPLRKLTVQCSLQDALAAWRHMGANLASLQQVTEAGGFKKDQLRGEIEFKDVWFRHGDQNSEWILQGVSFKIESGQHIALVGESGSGKSTIASLLTRRYSPTRGQIIIDNRDYLDYDVDWLRSQLAVLNAEPHLFLGTFADNIVGFDRPYDENRVKDAAALAGADGFISALKRGYKQSVIPPQLSEVEQSKISLARALYRSPQILILDSVSGQFAGHFDRHVIDQSQACTTLNIAAHVDALEKADGVLFLQNGRVAGFSPHSVLAAELPSYQSLCQAIVTDSKEPQEQQHQLNPVRQAPRFWTVSFSVTGLATAMIACMVFSLTKTVDVSIHAEGQLEAPRDFKTAVSVKAGQVDGLQVSPGQLVEADNVIAWMKTDGVSEQAIKDLIEDLGKKNQKVIDWTFVRSDMAVKASSAGDPAIKRQILDAQARLGDFLVKKHGSRNESLKAIATAKASLESYIYTHQVRTPVAGRVAQVSVKNGDTVAARQEILRLLPEQTVWTAKVFIPEKDLAHVHVGDLSRVHIDKVSRAYEGRVVKLEPTESKDGSTAVIDLNLSRAVLVAPSAPAAATKDAAAEGEKREPSSAPTVVKDISDDLANLMTASGARVQSEMISRKVSLYHFLFDPKPNAQNNSQLK